MPLADDLAKELSQAVDDATAKQDETTADGVTDESNVGTKESTSEGGDNSTAGGTGTTELAVEKESTSSGEDETVSDDAADESKSDQDKIVAAISDAVLTEAVRHGIPIEDARLFPSDAALGRAIQAVRKSIADLSPKPESKSEDDVDILASLPTLDADKFEPEVVGAFTALKDVIAKQQEQIKGLSQRTREYAEEATTLNARAAQNELTVWFDAQVEKLGEDFKDVLGIGATDGLLPSSSQRAMRDQLAQRTAALMAGYRAIGINPPSRDEVFAEASKLVLADKYSAIREQKLTDSLKKRSKQHIQRVGGKGAGSPLNSAADSAVEALRERFGWK